MIRQKRKFSIRAIALGIVLFFTPNAVAQAAEVATFAELESVIETLQDGDNEEVTLQAGGTFVKEDGGTIKIEGGRTVTINLNGQTINGNDKSGSIFTVYEGGELTIKDGSVSKEGTITGGTGNFNLISLSPLKYYYSGGVVENQGGKVTVESGNFIDNSADYGGVISNEGGSVNITGGNFTDNSAKNGGVIMNMSGDVTINGGKFTNNEATAYGGVIDGDTGSVTINSGEFEGNKAQYGGVVMNFDTLKINGGRFNNNSAQEGGVVYNYGNYGGNVVVTNGEFTNNTAATYGGAISSDGELTINGGIIKNNHAGNGGGGVLVYDSDAKVGGSVVVENNTRNSENDNIMVYAGKLSLSDEPLTSKAHVGVTIVDGGKIDISDATPDILKHIKSDNPENKVLELNEGNLVVVDRDNHTEHTYGNSGKDRYTCTSCGEIDDDLKAKADAEDAAAAENKTSAEEIKAPINNNSSVNVEATVSNGVATVKDIKEEDISKAIENGNNVVIDMSVAKQVVKEVVLPKTTVDTLAKTSVETVEIKLSNATIILDDKAIAAVSDTAHGSEVRLALETTKPDSLNEVQKDAVKELEVTSAFKVYVESNGVRIDDFRGGSATVNVKFNAESGRDPKYYHIYAVADDGTLERRPTKYLDGVLQFKTDSLSDYVIVYDETMENETV